MTDQPKPMSVDGMKKHAQAEAKLCGVGSARADWAIDNLIAAVRAECRAVNPCERKCVDFCNAYETGKSEERARVLAEFRMLASNLRNCRYSSYACHGIEATIQSLETPNKKP